MDPLPSPPESSPVIPQTNEVIPTKPEDLIAPKAQEVTPVDAENLENPVAQSPSLLNKTDRPNCTSCQQEFPSEISLLEHQILSHKKTEFQCKICQLQTSDAPQFRSHLAAHYVTTAVKVKSDSIDATIESVSTQLQMDPDPNPPKAAPASDNASDLPANFVQNCQNSTMDGNANSKKGKIAKKGRGPSKKFHYPTNADGKYMCTAPGCDFTTKYEFNLQRHAMRHGKRKYTSGKNNSRKLKRKGDRFCKPKEKNSSPPKLQPIGILKSTLTSPQRSPLDEPADLLENQRPESPKSVISGWIEAKKIQQQNGSSTNSKDDDDDNYLKSPSGKYKCNQCYYTTTHKFNMKKHHATHSNDRPYGCGYCEYRSRWEQNVKAHEKSQHFGIPRKPSLQKQTKIGNKVKKEIKKVKTEEPEQLVPIKFYQTELIEKETWKPSEDLKINQGPSRKSSTETLESAADGNFYCKDCDYVSRDKRLLISHMKRHSDERPFPCTFPGCGYRSKWSHWARAHERNLHGFSRSEQIKSTKKGRKPSAQSSRKFKPLSGAEFKPLTAAKFKPLTSAQIAKLVEGPSTKTLERFEQILPTENSTKKLIPDIGNLVGLKANEKIDCPQCGAKCYPRFLQRHMMVHSDEKPFGCPVKGCEYRTRWPADLKHHMKRHGPATKKRGAFLKRSSFRQVKNVKPVVVVTKTVTSASGIVKRFKCPDCDYHGATGWHVNRHRLTHGNVPPLSCPEEDCSFTTRDRRYLIRHQMEFHPDARRGHQGSTKRRADQLESEDKDCRFCEYLKKLAFYVRRYVKGCPRCKKTTVVYPAKVDMEVKLLGAQVKEKENEGVASMEQTELADSSGFACMLCDFVGDSKAAALEHAKSHPQPAIKISKLPEIIPRV